MNNQLIISKIINWSLAGNSRLDLISLVKTHAGKKITNLEIDELIKKSKQVLQDSVSVDKEQTINIHVGYYERLYKYFYSIDHVDGCNKAMAAKEKLLGMVGSTKITINRKTEINIHKNVRYDMDRLTPAQRQRLDYLDKKMEG